MTGPATGPQERLAAALARQPRARLATLPTALEPGPELPGGARLLVKRDDLTGLGLGGNKARKLEYLCGDARARGADTLVTVGAAQSNHARMTAAAGAVLGMPTHLVLGGDDAAPEGNQLLARLFGAVIHSAGTDDWNDLAAAADARCERLRADGRAPYLMPMGGSTEIGALGFVAAWAELMGQCEDAGLRPAAIVHATSTGGTHAGLLAGRALWRAFDRPVPELLAVSVAKESGDLGVRAGALARAALDRLGLADVELPDGSVHVDERWIGPDYAVPTAEGDAALGWAARHGGWVLDRTYTGKALGCLLAAGGVRFSREETVIFWHTGGHPAVFARAGSPQSRHTPQSEEAV